MNEHESETAESWSKGPHHSTVVDTTRWRAEYAVLGDGPAVLCLHGAMGGYDQSLILARTVGGQGYRYMALSRPGYLGTPLASGRSPEQQADLYAAVLDSLAIERAAVIAVSGGGPSAIYFALRHPDRCLGLVLVSTCADTVDSRIPFSFKLMKIMVRVPAIAATIKRKALADPMHAAQRSITNPELLARTRNDEAAWGLMLELQASTVDRMADRLTGTDNDIRVTRVQTYPLERVSVPALVLHGTDDPLLPFERHGKMLAARIPGAELVSLTGGGHAAIFSHRNEARDRVTRFLRRHVASAVLAPAPGPGYCLETGPRRPES